MRLQSGSASHLASSKSLYPPEARPRSFRAERPLRTPFFFLNVRCALEEIVQIYPPITICEPWRN